MSVRYYLEQIPESRGFMLRVSEREIERDSQRE